MYNNRPWRPAEYGEANECELCNCNGHAASCAFDEKLYVANGNRNGFKIKSLSFTLLFGAKFKILAVINVINNNGLMNLI